MTAGGAGVPRSGGGELERLFHRLIEMDRASDEFVELYEKVDGLLEEAVRRRGEDGRARRALAT